MPQSLEPITVRPDNLTSMVFESIRDSIVSSRLPPGSRLSEATLANQLSVSKTPVREALLRLRHIGLVEPSRGGLRVIFPSIRRIRDAYELRAGLEGVSGRYAAQRASADEGEQLLELAQQSLSRAMANDSDGFRIYDRSFHRAIAAAARNEVLQESVENVLVLTSGLRERDVHSTHDSIDCATEHIAISEAIQAGDADNACQSLTNHILHVMTMVLAAKVDGTEASTPEPVAGLTA